LRFLILHFLNRDRSWLEDRINPDEHEHNLCNIYIQYFYKIPDNQVDRSVSNQIAQRVGNYNRLFDNALVCFEKERIKERRAMPNPHEKQTGCKISR
jgi:hypothetical protein